MSASETGTVRPGLTVGSASEFSLFFRVKPGEGEGLRAALRDLQETPGYRPGDYGMAIATIHEARFVLFDDDTRLAFITSFDGPWDAYMEDFFTSGPTLALFDVIFRHVEGYDGPAGPGGGEGVRPRRASGPRPRTQRNYGGTVKEIRKALACERRVPAGARRSGGRRGAPASCAEAAARRGRRLAGTGDGGGDVGSHLGAAGAGGADRGHHGRVRVSEPGAAGASGARAEHAPVCAAVGAVLGRARLPLPAAAADAGEPPSDAAPFAVAEEEFVFDCVFSDPAAGNGARGQEGVCTTPAGRHGRVSRSTTSRAVPVMACACSPARAGIRSSWTRRRR